MSRLLYLLSRLCKAVSPSLAPNTTEDKVSTIPTMEQKQRDPECQEQAVFENHAAAALSTPEKQEQVLSGKCGENMTWELQADTLRITGTGTLCRTEELKSIQDQIKHLVIEEGCTAIDKGTFFFCKGLKSVKIPDTVTEIRRDAFCCCSSLTDIKLPSGLKVIGERAFDGCTALATLTLPDSVEDIGEKAFGDIPCTLYHNEPYRFLFPYRQPWMALQLFSSNGFQYVYGCNDNLF